MAHRMEEAFFKVRELFCNSDDKGRKTIKYGSPSVDVLNILQWNFGCHVSCTSDSGPMHRTGNRIFHLFFLLSRIAIFAEVFC